MFDRNRKLNQPEYEYSGRSGKGAYYVVAVDVGRRGCDTDICIIKVTPQPQGPSIKSLVNIYTLSHMHFEDQAIFIKKLYYRYKAKQIVLDGNGLKTSSLCWKQHKQIFLIAGKLSCKTIC